MLTAKKIKEHFIYNPETGEFTRLKTGKKIIYKSKNGYRRITIGNNFYYQHRCAWLYVYGEWPKKLIDHINNDKEDNRICNLREADKRTNGSNRKGGYSCTGFRCIYKQSNSEKYRVRIKNKHIGYYDSLENAIDACRKALNNAFGEFSGQI